MARVSSGQQSKWQYRQDSDSSSAGIYNHPARFESSQKGSNLGKREKIKTRKIKDPARFRNSQKVSGLGKRGNIR